MSDTKALYDVVADALANWGNGEAMDAFEALMGRLTRAEADNAALLGTMGSALQRMSAQDWYAAREEILEATEKPHPGAALLEELEGLRHNLGAIANLLGFAAGYEASDGIIGAVVERLQSINHIRDNTLKEAAHVARTTRHSVVVDESFSVYAKACFEIERRILAMKTGQGA